MRMQSLPICRYHSQSCSQRIEVLSRVSLPLLRDLLLLYFLLVEDSSVFQSRRRTLLDTRTISSFVAVNQSKGW
jgi:hypothetical protein